jgi:hypothetical protein
MELQNLRSTGSIHNPKSMLPFPVLHDDANGTISRRPGSKPPVCS